MSVSPWGRSKQDLGLHARFWQRGPARLLLSSLFFFFLYVCVFGAFFFELWFDAWSWSTDRDLHAAAVDQGKGCDNDVRYSRGSHSKCTAKNPSLRHSVCIYDLRSTVLSKSNWMLPAVLTLREREREVGNFGAQQPTFLFLKKTQQIFFFF